MRDLYPTDKLFREESHTKFQEKGHRFRQGHPKAPMLQGDPSFPKLQRRHAARYRSGRPLARSRHPAAAAIAMAWARSTCELNLSESDGQIKNNQNVFALTWRTDPLVPCTNCRLCFLHVFSVRCKTCAGCATPPSNQSDPAIRLTSQTCLYSI